MPSLEREKVDVPHQDLKHGDRCPECGKGNVYGQKEPKVLVRIVGQAPLAATVYSLERLRCGACGQVFTAEEPEGVGPEKYDETAAAMIAQLKYGSGTPFYRLEQLERHLGIPLPAATQWEIVEEAAEVDQAGARRVTPAGGARRGTAQRRYRHAGAALGARSGRPAHRCVHQRNRCDDAGPADRAVLHRTEACGREPGRRFKTAGRGVASADPDV